MASMRHEIKIGKDVLAKQGSIVKFEFPKTFTSDMLKQNVHPTCGCTSFSINTELEQITFEVKAPSYNYELSQPVTKTVTPYYKFPNGDKVEWYIEFYVNNKKDV